MDETQALLELEARRCLAISSADGSALRETLSDDYVHVHALGNIDDREGFVTGVLSNPRAVERGSIAMRFYGNIAILVGEQINRRGDTAMTGTMQQVALKRDGVWRFVSAQVTLKS